MYLLDRVGEKSRNKNSPDRMGLFQAQRRKAETLLLAWLSASLRQVRFGSKADMVTSPASCPLAPESRHLQRRNRCPLCANSRQARVAVLSMVPHSYQGTVSPL